MNSKFTDRSILAVTVVGSLVLLNVLGLGLFGRLDLTHDSQFTLSDATKDTLRLLTDPVTVRAYFTEDLPPGEKAVARYVKDLLDEYYTHSDGYFAYEFIDPVGAETDEDKEKKKEVKRDIFGRAVREATSIEKELQGLGIAPRQLRVAEDDELQIKRAYMGLVIKYGDETEVIPVVNKTAGLEYDITTLIRKLTRPKTPKVGILSSHEGVDIQEELGKLYGLLTQLYDVTQVDLDTNPTIEDDVDALVVVGPKAPFNDAQKRAIDAFVMSGRSVAFLLDTIKPDLRTLETAEANHGLEDLLASYGVTIQKSLALDAECATINIQRQQGFMRITQPVQYPYFPIAKALDAQHPVARGLGQVAFPFMSPVQITVAEGSDVKAEVVARTSEKGWTVTPPYDLDPLKRWTTEEVTEQKAFDLIVTLSGPLKSPYGNAPVVAPVEGEESNEPLGPVSSDARVLVAGGASFITDQFMSPSSEALALNLIDWLVLDEALLAVRTRGLSAAPIDEVSDGTRAFVKWGNIFGLPVVFVLFGVLRWRSRESRRGKVSL